MLDIEPKTSCGCICRAGEFEKRGYLGSPMSVIELLAEDLMIHAHQAASLLSTRPAVSLSLSTKCMVELSAILVGRPLSEGN